MDFDNCVTDGGSETRGLSSDGGSETRILSSVGGLETRRPDGGFRLSSDSGLGKRDSEVLVVVQLVVMQGDQSLNSFLHRRQLHQRHLPVLPVTAGEVTSTNT